MTYNLIRAIKMYAPAFYDMQKYIKNAIYRENSSKICIFAQRF